jgi:hypothetical protein
VAAFSDNSITSTLPEYLTGINHATAIALVVVFRVSLQYLRHVYMIVAGVSLEHHEDIN